MILLLAALGSSLTAAELKIIRSARSGAWSDKATWDGGAVPYAGDRVQIRGGHQVIYDTDSDAAIHVIHIAGALRFAPDRDTRLCVGLIRIEAGEEWKEGAIHCHDLPPMPDPAVPRPTLEIGSTEHPVEAGHTAIVRLVHFEGDDPECMPAIVCVAGQMDLHGAPLTRSWVKLSDAAAPGENQLYLADAVDGWRAGDRVVITATNRQRPFAGNSTDHVTERPASEEALIAAFEPETMAPRGEKKRILLNLDRRLTLPHAANNGYAAEVANLSRNVVIESATPDGVRGHTMYHRYSSGSISYAEFRHLGKKGLLGRYPIHYHLTGDTMRGSSVIGASVWDSDNRWITLHGTQFMIIRDCVGYRSTGHGFFLENGLETYNVLDRNLAIQAMVGAPLPEQALPYDRNDGAGFWWANSMNSFTRNVAVECDQHGFRFETEKTATFDPVLPIPQADGSTRQQDLRTVPFIRFDDNEAHAMRRFAVNIGGMRGMTYSGYGDQPESVEGDVDGIGPDSKHPFIVRNLKVWDAHWSFHGGSPSMLIDGMDLQDGQYGIWRSIMSRHDYRNLKLGRFASSAIFFPMGERDDMQIGLKDGKPAFPQLTPVDDLPPMSVITRIGRNGDSLHVQGSTIDNGEVSKVTVNGLPAKAERPGFAEWSITLPGASPAELRATAIDMAGNTEPRPHLVTLKQAPAGAAASVPR
ncbi:G8 domain-containing protein [Luteolibacter sp. Populi]|uniref:G8 domain-containing protein n=1 Tax=Luteolibacter sp. Populi TaxID=3230487 RepID=UPI0034667578